MKDVRTISRKVLTATVVSLLVRKWSFCHKKGQKSELSIFLPPGEVNKKVNKPCFSRKSLCRGLFWSFCNQVLITSCPKDAIECNGGGFGLLLEVAIHLDGGDLALDFCVLIENLLKTPTSRGSFYKAYKAYINSNYDSDPDPEPEVVDCPVGHDHVQVEPNNEKAMMLNETKRGSSPNNVLVFLDTGKSCCSRLNCSLCVESDVVGHDRDKPIDVKVMLPLKVSKRGSSPNNVRVFLVTEYCWFPNLPPSETKEAVSLNIERALLGPKSRLAKTKKVKAKRCDPSQQNVSSFFRFGGHEGSHEQSLIRSGDIEKNPGPELRGDDQDAVDATQNRPGKHWSLDAEVMVTTYNVRGLNDSKKLRHLINHCYQVIGSKNVDRILCFQETYIDKEGMIPLLWRGNFHLTKGLGNSLGCLTLLSSHLNVVAHRDIGDRAHILACQKVGAQGISYIVANIYAPNANNAEKINFFEEVFDAVTDFELRYECSNIVIAGDMNLIFKSEEAKNRSYGRQEKQVASAVAQMIAQSNLSDVWGRSALFTWRRPNSDVFSAIDRILYTKDKLTLTKTRTNWALSCSDHAAVESTFQLVNGGKTPRAKMSRLDPSLMKDEVYARKIKEDFSSMYNQHGRDWNPHNKLEYAKMCIRTVMEKVQADRKKKEANEEELLNLEIDIAVSALERGEGNVAGLIEHLEELRANKFILIEAKGQRLAERAGNRWYNEGEKSTRYFLRLLNRAQPDDFNSLVNEQGETITSEAEIEKEIIGFYKKLYENEDDIRLNVQNNDDVFFQHVQPVDQQCDDEISRPLTKEELWSTLNGCSDSAPGPDGIPYSVIRGLWPELGPVLLEAWNYSLAKGKLPPSHKLSFLKLIPKAGKELKNLTNWRPITLSNCDHKIITKTYALRLSSGIAKSIKERQTAYVKGRLINDNIRAILSSINAANLEQNIDGLVVSLDAKKAFDSVHHSYIEKCLEKFGAKKFIPIFRVLYNELSSDILINGRIVKGYKIERGVKQGDALSCILFIMCMEPLLLNIEANQHIVAVRSETLGNLPKVYAYADDVNGVVRNDERSLKEIFKEYNRLTEISGLELNASKTELLRFKSGRGDAQPIVSSVSYRGQDYDLQSVDCVKINGILFLQDQTRMRSLNVAAAVKRIEQQCQRWTRRHLSLLGKILILKTFGISQLIFLMQSIKLEQKDFVDVNRVLYKFLWNRNFNAPKAPERIKREIINKSIRLGGFGMLNIEEIDKSLKLKALGRLFSSEHPLMKILREKLKLRNFFYPRIDQELDKVSSYGINVLGRDRRRIWELDSDRINTECISIIKDARLTHVANEAGRNSLELLRLRIAGVHKVGDLTDGQLNGVARFLDPKLTTACRQLLDRRPPNNPPNGEFKTLLNNKLLDLKCVSSKYIRENRSDQEPICVYRSGLLLGPNEALTWALKTRKLTCIRHRSSLLRVAHKEIYTKEKLHRFNLIDSPNCTMCGGIEDFRHKITECEYSKRIWTETFKLTDKLSNSVVAGNQVDTLEKALGADKDSTVLTLTIHAEVMQRILALRDQNYVIHPKRIPKMAIALVMKREKQESVRTMLGTLLND